MLPAHNMHKAQYITRHATSQQTLLHNTTLHTKQGTAQQRTPHYTPHPTAVQYNTAQHSTAHLRLQIITTRITVHPRTSKHITDKQITA